MSWLSVIAEFYGSFTGLAMHESSVMGSENPVRSIVTPPPTIRESPAREDRHRDVLPDLGDVPREVVDG
jgi:hypothetical protein